MTKRQNKLASLEQEAQSYFYFVSTAGMDTDATMFSWHLSRLMHVIGKMRRLRVSSRIPMS